MSISITFFVLRMQTSRYSTSCTSPPRLAFDLMRKPVVRAVDGEVEHADGVRAAVGFAADRHAVAAIEVVVRDRDVRARPGVARLDRDVVVAGVDVAARDRDVRRAGRIDAVGVPRALVGAC